MDVAEHFPTAARSTTALPMMCCSCCATWQCSSLQTAGLLTRGDEALQSGPHESYSLKAMENEFREHPDLMFTWAVTSAFISKFNSGDLQPGLCSFWSA